MSKVLKQKQIDILLMGIFRWDGSYSSISIALAKEFARHNRVFYINHPNSVKDILSNNGAIHEAANRSLSRSSFQEIHDQLIIVDPPLSLPVNWLPDGAFYDWMARYNYRLTDQCIQQTIKKYQIKDFIYINCFDPYVTYRLPSALRPLLTIYQSVDDISQSDYTVKHGPRLEIKAIQAADITLVTSTELHRLQSAYSSQVHILNNAADTRIFRRALEEEFPRPKELQKIKGPIIGYMGNLDNMRVNYDLLKQVAETHQDKTLVLIGPINNNQYLELGLDKMPNVIFTGGKPIEELPRYLKYFDCALIPFHCNTLTRSIYPLKINEYLAAGKAVVSTNFSEDISGFKEHIFLAANESDFVARIDQAIAHNTETIISERLAVAQSNTWAARVAQFWQIIKQALEGKGLALETDRKANYQKTEE
ncbi:MAG: glycosyltransferase [Bacteroidota bacterium]